MPKIDEVLNRRADLSTFVVHLTRAAAGATASANLRSILTGKRIEARSAMGWARDEASQLGGQAERSQHVVSFSEVPLEHIYSLCADIEGRSVCLEPYGLAFTKMVARRKGVNPVWYVDMTPGRNWILAQALDSLRNQAIASGNFPAHHGAKILPFAEPMGTWPPRQREFWWEREWRHLGDFAFDLEDVAFVICPEQEHQRFENLAKPKKCVDANWSLERMVAKLVGLTPSDISPFSPR
jgi:hypothetical protein